MVEAKILEIQRYISRWIVQPTWMQKKRQGQKQHCTWTLFLLALLITRMFLVFPFDANLDEACFYFKFFAIIANIFGFSIIT